MTRALFVLRVVWRLVRYSRLFLSSDDVAIVFRRNDSKWDNVVTHNGFQRVKVSREVSLPDEVFTRRHRSIHTRRSVK